MTTILLVLLLTMRLSLLLLVLLRILALISFSLYMTRPAMSNSDTSKPWEQKRQALTGEGCAQHLLRSSNSGIR